MKYKYHSYIGDLVIEEEDRYLLKVQTDSLKTISEKITYNNDSIIGKQIDEYLLGIRKEFDVLIKLIGTEFQLKVWNELRKIPYGKTLSYKDIAIRINNDKSVRAVGTACNRNPILIIVPCHRVIGKNGDLVGFGAGLELKEKLLLIEKENR